MAEKESKFFWAYFISAIIYAIIGLVDSLFLAGAKESIGQVAGTLSAVIFSFLGLIIFVLSIIALIVFIKKKFAKITLVMPIYHIAVRILIFVFSFTWGLILASKGIPPSEELMPISIGGLRLFGIVTSLFELGFSSYILYRFR